MNPTAPSSVVANASAASQPAPSSTAAGEKFRILVVEDDANIARVVLVTLSKMGFECRLAVDGPSGIEAFKTAPPHLVILDLGLPGMDGRDVCTEIRKTSTVPVIVMTANDSEIVEMQSFKLGADDFVSKPFNPQLLVARVVASLRRTYRYDAPGADAEAHSVGQAAAQTSNGSGRDLAAIAGVPSAEEEATDEPGVPAGWAKCEACKYMGPRQKFEVENALGRRGLQCPNCKQSEFVVFSIG